MISMEDISQRVEKLEQVVTAAADRETQLSEYIFQLSAEIMALQGIVLLLGGSLEGVTQQFPHGLLGDLLNSVEDGLLEPEIVQSAQRILRSFDSWQKQD